MQEMVNFCYATHFNTPMPSPKGTLCIYRIINFPCHLIMNILLLNSYVGVVFSTKKGNKSIIEISIKCSSPSLGMMIDTQESSLYYIYIKYPCSVTLGYRCHHSLISIGKLDSSFKNLINHGIDVLLQQGASWKLHCLRIVTIIT